MGIYERPPDSKRFPAMARLWLAYASPAVAVDW
jgi:hypothetical protein